MPRKKPFPPSELLKRLRQKIDASELSDYALARKIKVAQPTIWAFRNGEGVRATTLIRMMEYFGLKVVES